MQKDDQTLCVYGVVIFKSTNFAVRAERVVSSAGINAKLIPAPRHLSYDCGVALRFLWSNYEAIKTAMDEGKAGYESIHKLD